MPVGGDMRERLRFERRTIAADDGYGNVSYDWDLIAGPYAARLEPSGGTEAVESAHVVGVQPVAITIRWCPKASEIRPQDRARDTRSNRTWNIAAVANEDGRRQYLNIAAVSGVADG